MALYAGVSSQSVPTISRVRNFARAVLLIVCALLFTALPASLRAQDGSAQVEGTITDPTGAAVPKAAVTATNVTTGVVVKFESNKTGGYLLSPLQPGEYTIAVEANGFEKHVQEHVILDGFQKLSLSIKLKIGSDQQTVTITDAPPMLDTADASIGGTIENEMYSELPLSMGGAPRDPTAFQFLMPGVQEGTGRGVFGGSGQENLNEVYLDGVPMTNATAQGSSTPISSAVSVDAVDQFQVKTNGGGVALGGIGVTNYTLKSGGNKFHGTVFDYTRNTLFDSWGYFSKVPNATGYARKPGEHQNSYGVALGGPIIHDKFFFFGTYEGFHYTKISNTPQYITVPTARERLGDFTEVFGTASAGLYDPTAETNPNSTTRTTPFRGLLNGLPTYNVINPSEFSQISLNFAKALPAATNGGTSNNYLAGLPLENEDYRIDTHLDYNINHRNTVSLTGVGGTNGYGQFPNYSTQQQLPEPYAVGDYQNSRTASGVITYTFVASQASINTLKYGFSRTWGPGFAPSKGTPFTAANAGIQNLPPGNATNAIPDITFGYNASTSPLNPYSWGGSGDTGGGGTNTFTIIDNFTMVRGRHNIVFGFQYQWLEANGNTYGTYSNTLENDYNAFNTECIPTTSCVNGSGNAYASYLVGAVYRSRVEAQSITTIGGRYHPFAPYINDNWRATSRLTLDLGLRWDYLQPYHEVLDRIAFLNPHVINPAINFPGGLSYAGYGPGPNSQYTPYICQCSTPVRSHVSNFEPRFGITYALTNKTVLRGGWGIMTTHAGGVGGRAGATVGTGTSQYSATTVWQQNASTNAPAFFLNPGLTTSPESLYGSGPGATQANTSSIPTWTVPGNTLNPLGAAGNYFPSAANPYGCGLNPDGSCEAEPLNYADPNYGGRGPQFMNWNFGFQHMIDKAAVLSVNYAGSQTHFLAGGGNRGYATNSISPDYVATLGPAGLLATLTNGPSGTVVQAVQKIIPGFQLPYPTFGGQTATVLKALSPFPQFLNNTDLWGQTGNSNYNALQVSIIQRPWHRLSGLLNWTYSKSIDDTHGHRAQYPVGPADGNFSHYYPSDRVDRGVGTYNQTHVVNATWVYTLPFGRGAIGGNHFWVRAIGSGWGLSGIYKYRPGLPLQVTNGTGCLSATDGGQGTCLPDYAPGSSKSTARINGKWGRGPGANASNIQYIQYLNPATFQCPDNTVCSNTNTASSWKLGNIAKSAPYGLIGPGYWDVDMGLRRTFQLRETPTFNLRFNVEADVINTTNSTFFTLGNGGAAWGTCAVGTTPQNCPYKAFGTVGGQNQSVPPRDWQFAGRFTF